MCGWPNTSDSGAPSAADATTDLLEGLRTQPLLAVLRPLSLAQARHQLEQLQAAGLQHVELAVEPGGRWAEMVLQLRCDFPGLRFGAASIRCTAGLQAAFAAGLRYAVSPIFDASLLERSRALGMALVPGVFTPMEIAQAQRLDVAVIKLFPAVALGPAGLQCLRAPLAPLPFCIAAGGLELSDVEPWLRAGADAVAVGSSLFDNHPDSPLLQGDLPSLLQRLRQRADAR